MDASIHGAGFLARLSGSTAEFLSMWHVMMYGRQPFIVGESDGALALRLRPALPAWIFDDESKVSFTFLGHVTVTYYNYASIDTWDAKIPRTHSRSPTAQRRRSRATRLARRTR